MADPKQERSFKEGAQKRILVVDDDAALSKLLESFFTKAGFEARSTTKGKEAIEIYKELRPHLVLLDILLPDLMGFDVIKRMRDASWTEGNVHFIMMSGIMKDKKIAQEVVVTHKAHEFIEKPFHVRELHRSIAKHLGLPPPEEEKKPDAPAAHAAKTGGGKAPAIPSAEVTIEGGDLATTDMAHILVAFYVAKVTGVLKLANAQNLVKAIYFEKGRAIFAASQDPNDRLGEVILREGVLSKKEIDAALTKAQNVARLGSVLIEMGHLTQSDLVHLIQTQVRDIIVSCFGWSEGRYAFHFEDLASREMIKLDMSTPQIILDGIRRALPQKRLNAAFSNRQIVLKKSNAPLFSENDLGLSPADMNIISSVDGQKTLEQILGVAKQAKVSDTECLQTLYAFLTLKTLTP